MAAHNLLGYIAPRWLRLVAVIEAMNKPEEKGDRNSIENRKAFVQGITEIAKVSVEIRDAFLIHAIWSDKDGKEPQ